MTKNSKISNDELYKLQSDLNCSNNTIYKIAKAVRKGSNSNRIIEPHLRNKIVEKNHKLDSFFEERDFPFIREKAKNVTQEPERVIICKDTKGFINFVCGEREQNADELHFKFGIDGGGGFLKICVSLQIKEESKTMKIQNSTKKFKSSGVKKVLLLCAAPNVQENFTDVKLIWSALDINDLLGTVATDLKLANIITGLMTHTSTHPCTWCDAQSGKLNLCGNSRSIGNCVRNYECWIHEGKNYKKAKNYKNCVNLPVFSSLDSRKEILDIIPPPELHLMIGAVNTIFNDMMIKFEEVSLLWAKNCHVERSLTYGSPAFEGNQCKKLLDSVDKLRAICNLECLKFVKAFENLKKVVDSCFSSVLKDTYQNDIDEFQKSFLDLGTSVTPKIHALFHHVPQFCLKNKCGLGFYSEQAVESLHHDFSASWNNYKVLKSHPNYSKHLQRAVCEYNCHHI